MVIVFYHMAAKQAGLGEIFASQSDFFAKLLEGVSHGNKAVDMFFILSGFILVLTFKQQVTFWDFVKKKIARLWPTAVFAMGAAYVLSLFKMFKWAGYENLMALLFLDGTGLMRPFCNVGVLWFVGTLFWCSLFYFYIIKNFPKKNVDFAVALITFFGYVILISGGKGNLSRLFVVYGDVLSLAFLRGLAGMGLGYFIANAYAVWGLEWREKKTAPLPALAFTAAEIWLLAANVWYLCFHKIKFYNNFIFIIMFVGLFLLFLAKRGYISRFLECNFSVWLGKYAYSIFLTHCLVRVVFLKCLWKVHPGFVLAYPVLNTILPVIVSVLTGMAVYHLAEKPAADYLTKKWFPAEK